MLQEDIPFFPLKCSFMINVNHCPNLTEFINKYSITLRPLNNSRIWNPQSVLQCQCGNDHNSSHFLCGHSNLNYMFAPWIHLTGIL